MLRVINGSSNENPMLKAASTSASTTTQRCFERYDKSTFMSIVKIKKGNGCKKRIPFILTLLWSLYCHDIFFLNLSMLIYFDDICIGQFLNFSFPCFHLVFGNTFRFQPPYLLVGILADIAYSYFA